MPKRKGFRRWLSEAAAIRGWDANEMLNDDTYNYELFYNQQPREADAMLKKNSDAHFTDIGKTVYHPTFSNESYYSGKRSIKNPRGVIGGTWSDDTSIGRHGSRYTLSQSQIQNGWNIPRTIDYLSWAEDNGATLRMPDGSMPIVNGTRFGGVLPAVTVIGKYKKK